MTRGADASTPLTDRRVLPGPVPHMSGMVGVDSETFGIPVALTLTLDEPISTNCSDDQPPFPL